MLVKTILNRIEKHRGFVYASVRLEKRGGALELDVYILPRANSRARCSGCQRQGPGYDTLPPRRFEYVPLWGILVFFVYAMRRVQCDRCGVRVEVVPWGDGKCQLTTTYSWFLARWARRMSWAEVARSFRTSWQSVFRAVEKAVLWGREHQNLEGIASLGIDEIYWSRKEKYLTLVYQLDEGRRRLLWIGRERKAKTLLGFFRWFGKARSRAIRFVCSDMWRPYLSVVAKKAGAAIHVLDRFHVMSHMSKAIDKVRAQEVRKIKAAGGVPVLKDARWLLLKRPENLTAKQDVRLVDLLGHNLRSVRAYLLREDFQFFWQYVSPHWAGAFLDRWCTRVMRARIDPMKRVARMLRKHRGLLLNWFRARGTLSVGAVEGLNNKAKVVTKRAFGFRSYRVIEIALYHSLGRLPEPKFTHQFC